MPQLGLVCITASKEVRYRTITRKRLLQLAPTEQEQVLQKLYKDNLQTLNNALDFCDRHHIQLYRLTSALFPFADSEEGEGILPQLSAEMKTIGDRAKSLKIRIVIHPDQFVVISSDTPTVIENSIKILQTQAQILEMLGLDRSPWNTIEIHGGKSNRAERLVEQIRNLPEPIRCRLALENDEYAYSATEILEVCQAAGVPMVFDAHHHVIHEGLDSYEHPSVAEMLAAARTTWPVAEWQLVHISNGRKAFGDPNHSDLISTMPSSYTNAPWIEIEAKFKEQAIKKIHQEWLI
ncbi:MAG: UV DNA damage repair endonuclease UvsE [Cyanosarcina radialis HA8281-LM2]|jgi:UV DNA damage endonuclease|nr:UV DNA damage repair endonuclease UvsE [Cyanosarcina radialis HA8281-LM2]